MPRAEDPYFRDPVYRPDRAAYEAFARRYAAAPRSARHIGMKCPDYLARPEVPGRLAQVLDRPKLIATLRSPIQRAVSAYYWKVNWGLLPLLDAETGLAALLDGGLRDSDPSAGDVLEWGLYHQHIARFLQHFDRDRLHIILDSDFRSDPAREIAGVCNFLQIDENLAPQSPTGRRNEGIYSPVRLRHVRRRNKYTLRWSEDGTYAQIPRPRRPWPLAVKVSITLLDRYVLAHVCDNAPPTLSVALQQRLWSYYRDDVDALSALIGRDLSHWRPACVSPQARARTPDG
jgi:hypothetical protein